MNHKPLVSRIQAAAGLLLVALCWLVAGSLQERVVAAGDKAPNFKVTTDKGKVLSRSSFGGKVLVLNFWATWCPPCIEEIPSLDAMSRQLASKGVVVLGVSVDRNPQTYRSFLERAGVSFETALDPDANISADYGTFKYPETYIIGPDGKVRIKYIGPRDWTDPAVRGEIEALL